MYEPQRQENHIIICKQFSTVNSISVPSHFEPTIDIKENN